MQLILYKPKILRIYSELPGDNNPYGSAGIELDAYPTVRSFVFGVNVKF